LTIICFLHNYNQFKTDTDIIL